MAAEAIYGSTFLKPRLMQQLYLKKLFISNHFLLVIFLIPPSVRSDTQVLLGRLGPRDSVIRGREQVCRYLRRWAVCERQWILKVIQECIVKSEQAPRMFGHNGRGSE